MMASSSSSSFVQEMKESAEDRSVMSLLSDDALLVMLRCLSTRELLSTASLVCRRWRRLCRKYLVFELVPCPFNPSDKPWGSMTERKLLGLAESHCFSLERLSLHGLKRVKSSEIISLLPRLQKLREFSIVSCTQLLSTDLEAVVSQLPSQLVSLDLHSDHFATLRCHDCVLTPPARIDDMVISSIHQRCPNLQSLNLDSCSNISMQALDPLLQACQFLTSLDLHSHALGWPEVAKIFTSCKSLRHFSLVSPLLVQSPSCVGEDRGERHPRVRPRLRRGDDSAGRGLPNVAELPRDLTSLRLYQSPHRSIAMELAPMLGLLKASGMQLLHLHAQGVYNTSWQTIQTWCPNLKLLDLSHCKHETVNLTGVEELVLTGLVKMLKRLEYLALPSATDSILKQIGQYCPHLKELRFQGYGISASPTCYGAVTDGGVVAVAEGCPELAALSLAGCRKISISSIRAIAFHCRKLKVLILNQCRGIKDDAVAAMMPRLSTTLVLLDLVGCKITEASVHTIVQYAKETTLRVVVIRIPPCNYSKTVVPLCNTVNACHPRFNIKLGTSGIHWDGFYNGVSFHNTVYRI